MVNANREDSVSGEGSEKNFDEALKEAIKDAKSKFGGDAPIHWELDKLEGYSGTNPAGEPLEYITVIIRANFTPS